MTATTDERPSTFFGHPMGLPVVVSLKVWELFSYQGMKAFLVFYLIAAFDLSDARAAVIFGSYAALVLATSTLGGAIADRWLGQREPVVVGAVLVMGGHATLALQHLLQGLGLINGQAVFQLFCFALALIAVGTGVLKPNVLNLVGGLYQRTDPRRESGFYLYYLGVNVGSFLSPLVCGSLAQHMGWSWGFGAAAVGMAAGLSILLLGRRKITRADGDIVALFGRPRPPRLRIYGAVALAVLLAVFLIQYGFVLAILLLVTLAGGIAYLLTLAARDRSGADRRAVLRLLCILPIPLLFVVVFEQFSLSVNLFSDRLVDREVFGVKVAAAQLIALNPFFVLLLLPPLAMLWTKLRAAGREPGMPQKFAIGFFFMGAGFAVLSGAIFSQAPGASVAMAWVVATYFLITIGELMIAPLTYAVVGLTVPARLEGVGMSLLLLNFALGNLCAGLLASQAGAPDGATPADLSGIYGGYFLVVCAVAMGAAVASLALGRITRPEAAAPDAAAPEAIRKLG